MRRVFFWFSLAIAATIAIRSVDAQTAQTPQLAYASAYGYQDPSCCPPVSGACNDFCPYYDFNWFVVTPSGKTPVPSEVRITWSADGKKIAFDSGGDIFVADASGTNAINVTNTANNETPAWSPDGTRIAFASTRDNPSGELYLMNPDGSNVARLTYNLAFSVVYPAWSHDGSRIAFDCQVDAGNDDICAISPDGTGFSRLTTDPASDGGPTWSPDGLNIAFSTTRYGNGPVIAVMNANGSDVVQVGSEVTGWEPAWSPDGAQIAFADPNSLWSDYGYNIPDIYIMQADGTNVAAFQYSAAEPAWMPARVPVATFNVSCTVGTCNFDASGSQDTYGTITDYAWSFGDGMTGAGAIVAHTFIGGNKYTVMLTVKDSNGATGTKFRIMAITSPVIASFTFGCAGLTCTFNGSGSRDSNGTITSYTWAFGDSTTGSGSSVTHAYTAGGQYRVTLIAKDQNGATNEQSQTVFVNAPPVASFTFSCSRFTCTFDDSGSYDSDGSITSWAWSFGDGTTVVGGNYPIGHIYAVPGTYTVTLTVTDNGGATGIKSTSVSVPPKH